MHKTSRPLLYVLIIAGVTGFVSYGSQEPAPALKPSTPYELQYPAYFGNRYRIPEDNPMTQEGIQLGRYLFYEKKLSANDQISCASCHRQELAFTDGQAFSAGVDGSLTSRNSMSLANLLWVRKLFWDGRAGSLEEQAAVPLTNVHEMGQPLEASCRKLRQDPVYPDLFQAAFGSAEITGDLIVKAIAQFERTLISAGSLYDQYLQGSYQPSPEQQRGINLFMTPPAPERGVRGANCGHCHGSPKTFIELFHNNGLDSLPQDSGREQVTGYAADRGRFRVPTLRNIALTAPYMHDGRFSTLEAVLDHYNEHVQDSPTLSPFIARASNEAGGRQLLLNRQEKADILAFLYMLTDTAFITNAAFSDPHLQKE